MPLNASVCGDPPCFLRMVCKYPLPITMRIMLSNPPYLYSAITSGKLSQKKISKSSAVLFVIALLSFLFFLQSKRNFQRYSRHTFSLIVVFPISLISPFSVKPDACSRLLVVLPVNLGRWIFPTAVVPERNGIQNIVKTGRSSPVK